MKKMKLIQLKLIRKSDKSGEISPQNLNKWLSPMSLY